MIDQSIVYSIVVLIGSAIFSYGMDRRDKKWNEQENERILNMIAKIFEWKDQHIRDSAEIRLHFSEKIAEVEGLVKVNASQYAEIIRRLGDIDQKMGRLENQRRDG